MGAKTGRVKIYNKRRGFGIIQSDNSDYFFRWTDIVSNSHKQCRAGERVIFTPQQHMRGLRAVEVKSVG